MHMKLTLEERYQKIQRQCYCRCQYQAVLRSVDPHEFYMYKNLNDQTGLIPNEVK